MNQLAKTKNSREITQKSCVVCGKPVGKPNRGPARNYCSKRCKAVAHERRWRTANPDKKHAMNQRYYLANSEQVLERHRRNRAESRKNASPPSKTTGA
jgi:endogenous inhibitor of DNA gyrase (YacG/DUF329 family)